jgi:hypothetical protein
MGFNDAPASKTAEEQAFEALIEKSFSLRSLSLKGSNVESDNAHIANGSYNVNQGVILIKSNDSYYALPETRETIEILQNDSRIKDERMGVPYLNDREMWTNPDGESFKEWKQMVESAQA